MSQQHSIGSHATTVASNDKGIIRITYHSTVVVAIEPDGGVTLDSGGWRTNTTKTRMNQASNQYKLGYKVYQKTGDWFINMAGIDVPFYDGIHIKAVNR